VLLLPYLFCRPLEWSDASVIFTAHPTQPLVTARHFSSSKTFIVSSPTPVVSSPASYEPPSIISAAPGSHWLFAYFPRRDGDGIACMWERGVEIDNWKIKEWWSLAQGAGVVAASWTGVTRQVRDTINSLELFSLYPSVGNRFLWFVYSFASPRTPCTGLESNSVIGNPGSPRQRLLFSPLYTISENYQLLLGTAWSRHGQSGTSSARQRFEYRKAVFLCCDRAWI
jgi:hypothetical protein